MAPPNKFLTYPEVLGLVSDTQGPVALCTLNAQIYDNLCARFFNNAGFKYSLDSRWLQSIELRFFGGRYELLQGSSLVFSLMRDVPVGTKIGFLGGNPNSQKLASNVAKKCYGRELVLLQPESASGLRQIADQLTESEVKLLFVCLGSPRQECLMAELLTMEDVPNLVMIGAGGAIDFFAGTKVRAPRWLQNLGLEGAWRLLAEPNLKRLSRLFVSARGVVRYAWNKGDLRP